jgi:Heterokaryon incompatibility protein Het-C
MAISCQTTLLVSLIAIVLLASPAHAFGAGSKSSVSASTESKLTCSDIASISAIEGRNWRHGDIEDTLKMVACIKGHKWTSMMIKRVYFGYDR